MINNVDELTGPYAEALGRGELFVQRCADCDAKIMYPKYRCPACFSDNLGWVTVTGEGELQTFTVLRMGAPSAFAVDPPYAIGVVRLDEGPQLMARLHADDNGGWDHYACGQRVRFQPADAAEVAARPAAWFGVA
jgi:uncharacterized OB-fold protein